MNEQRPPIGDDSVEGRGGASTQTASHAFEPSAEETLTIDPGGRGLPGDRPSGGDEGGLGRGASVGRYLVLGRLGEGGMGRVYSAYDPDLDRRVALKVLRPRGSSPSRRRRLEARLLEEAKTLARLSHPNVVTIFDVGTVRFGASSQRVFIAMELVQGANLASWTRRQERTVPEILRVFQQAGAGLAAAHRAGIVHLDFKPSNVLVGRDGRARVCDFGVARPMEAILRDDSDTSVERPSQEPRVSGGPDPGPGRGPGRAGGTPVYMAPEQWAGKAVGPEADQFAFCVALARVLGLPIAGAGPRGGEGEASDPTVAPDPASGPRRIPARVEKVIRRGTRENPGERYATMDELLAELGSRSRWRRVLPLLGLTLAVVGFVSLRDPDQGACGGGAALAADFWSPEIRQRLTGVFTGAAARPFAGAALRGTLAALEQRHDSWVDQFTEACWAHRRGEQSARLLDRRMTCLEDRRQETVALLGSLIERGQVEDAVAAVSALPALEACKDPVSLLAPVPLPQSVDAEAVAEQRRRLAQLRAWRLAGRYDEALAAAEPVVERARDLGHWPLISEALLERGLAEELSQRAPEAESTLRDALLAAEAGRHDRVAVEAFLRLHRLVGYERGDAQGAAELAAMGGTLLAQLGERRRLEATLENHLGLARLQAGEPAEALGHHWRALELLEAGGGAPGHFDTDRLARAGTHVRLGNAARSAANLDLAHSAYRTALDLYTEVHGDAHPEVALALERLGGVAAERGDLERASNLRIRAVEILRRAYGEHHPQVADVSINLGAVQLKLGDFEQALRTFEHVEQSYLRSRGEEHPKMAAVLGNLASAYLGLGDGEKALESYGRALELRASTLGAEHPATALVRFNHASTLNELGRPAEALAGHRRALVDWRRRLGDKHTLVAHGLTGVGRSLADLGRFPEAEEVLEQALGIWAEADGDPIYPARTRFHLARALWELDRRERALALATDARAAFSAAPGARKYLDAVDRWLTGRRPADH